jgi:hypothetical protein
MKASSKAASTSKLCAHNFAGDPGFGKSIGSSFKPFWIGLRPIVFNNRDGATARRFIWLRQMRDLRRRKGVRSTLSVVPSRRRGY